METGFDWIGRHGFGASFALPMLGIVGVPVPDETLLIFVGYLSFKGTLRLEPAEATAFLGSAIGSLPCGWPLVDQQLTKAGVRLAKLLNEALGKK